MRTKLPTPLTIALLMVTIVVIGALLVRQRSENGDTGDVKAIASDLIQNRSQNPSSLPPNANHDLILVGNGKKSAH